MADRRKQILWLRRKQRIRKKVSGSLARPRLTVFRSTNHIYAQVIDDVGGRTLVSASTLDKSLKGKSGATVGGAKKVGELLAERLKQAGITRVVFDRNGYLYHGRVKVLADTVRESGVDF